MPDGHNDGETAMGDENSLVATGLSDDGLGEGLVVQDARAEPLPADGSDNLLVLRMDELLPDSGGEVVILDTAGEGLAIVTQDLVSGQGVSDTHVTASGLDVHGYAFTTFDSGITIFYPSEAKLLVLPETA